jgi:uncharacterized protein (TIGR00251 family)
MGQIEIRVQPRSSRSKIEVTERVVKVWVTASPTDGQANAALCDLLAKVLGVPKTSVTVVRGQTSRVKVIAVASLDAEQILGRLAA